jgi:two-component sensor histidine kinase
MQASRDIQLQPLVLVQEITHRVLNEYSEAISSLALAAARAPDATSELALTSAALRLRARAEAHRALQSPSVKGRIDLAGYLDDLCERLNRALLADACTRLTVCADEIWLDADYCWRVGLIVAELVRNATRHGTCDGPGAINVETRQARGRIVCQVCNDADGGSAIGRGRGRGLVEAFAAELGGSVVWTFAPGGCCVRLEFPLPGQVDRGPTPHARG